MEFMTGIRMDKLIPAIGYGDRLFLTGSCFTEHIGNALTNYKFNVLQNPHGILFDPSSVAVGLLDIIDRKEYNERDLIYLNELWQSWNHHSCFSSTDSRKVLQDINTSIQNAHDFLKNTDWIIITLGSSFTYVLNETNPRPDYIGKKVANCHRAPAGWFHKKMQRIDDMIAILDTIYHRLKIFNPSARIIFTISPVRHLRDGVVENNRSKAKLIECVHHLVQKFDSIYYFPAYELVIDVLRDYRFYDIDFAHPNYQATEFVLQHFEEYCIDEASRQIMKEVKQVVTASRHRPFHPETKAHKNFLQKQLMLIESLKMRFPLLDLSTEENIFKSALHSSTT